MVLKLLSSWRKIIPAAALLITVSTVLPASSLFVGFNTETPVQVFDMSGHYVQDFGPSGAFAAFPDGSGSYFSVTPASSFTSSNIAQSSQTVPALGNFTLPNLITDGGVDAGNLLFSAYDGTIYRVTTTGTVLSSWSTGYSHVGVTSDGTNVFTTEGDSGNLIDIWSPSGTSIGHIATPFNGLYGLGYDRTTGDFWAGSTNFVYQLSNTGSLLATLNLSGDSRTPNGAVHDGLEVGDLSGPTTTPEPSTLILLFGGFLLLLLYKSRTIRVKLVKLTLSALTLVTACFASVNVSLTPSIASGAPVGSTIKWVASASDSTNRSATFTYQFSVGPSNGPLQVRRDFYFFNYYPWTPIDSEGVYKVQVVVRSSTGATGEASDLYTLSSRASGSSPVVSRTNHPLVALYSMPACPAGESARVRFKLPSDPTWQVTPTKACTGTTSLNFYVAGMRATTTYQLQQDILRGPFVTPGPVLNFTTGAIPGNIIVPFSIPKPFTAPNKTAYPVLLLSPIGGLPYATDTSGYPIWYLPISNGLPISFFERPIDGGTFFVVTYDGVVNANHLLGEYDLAGNLVRETNYAAISQQLVARGADPITTIHHDAIRLPDGGTAFIASSEKVADQGSGPVDVLGDQIIVVDANLQLKWWWSEFDHLDITRPATLGELCHRGNAGCPYITNPNYSVANDWTHSNSVWLAPDGNFLLSSRHQDWVMKVRYENGRGDGALLWKLGEDGDFRVSSSDPHPWQSHQHNAEIQPNGLLSLFDNGNTRIQDFGGHSRGQVWQLDETNKVAKLVVNLDLGDFSSATGSTQLLSNGTYTFNLGVIGSVSATREFNTSNVLESAQNSTHNSYRSFRMRSLYQEH